MQAETKFAIIVVLVAIIGVSVYFFRRGNEEPIALDDSVLTQPIMSMRTDDSPLPIGRRDRLTPGPLEETVSTDSAAVPRKDALKQPEKEPLALKFDLDLDPLDDQDLTTQPATVEGRDKIDLNIVPNRPAVIDLQLPSQTTTTRDQTRETTHVVRSGETLYHIARQHYGRGEMWTLIARANPQVRPERLMVGDRLTIPAVDSAQETFGGSREEIVVQGDYTAYTVKQGDSLYNIALDHFGEGNRWKEIYDLNKSRIGDRPENLRYGQTIYLPKK